MREHRTEKDGPGTARGFVRDRLTWVVYALVGYFAYLETSLGPIMPFMKAERDFSYTVASLHFSAFASGGVLIGLLGERVTRRWGRRGSLWGGGAGMSAGTVLLASSPSTAGTILGALLMGTGGSLLLITTQAILSDGHGPVHGAVALTESNAVASACAIAASLSVGVFSDAGFGWRAALFPPLLAFALLSPGIRLRPPREGEEIRRQSGGSRRRLPVRFWVYWGVLSLGVAIEWCITYWGAAFLKAGVGLSNAEAAEALSIFPAAMLTGRILGSALARFFPAPSLLTITLIVALAGFPLFWLPTSGTPTLVGLAITGLGMGSVYPFAVSAGVSSVPGESDRTTARLSLGASGAILLAPFVLGALSDHTGIASAYGIVLPMLVMAVILMLVSLRPRGGA